MFKDPKFDIDVELIASKKLHENAFISDDLEHFPIWKKPQEYDAGDIRFLVSQLEGISEAYFNESDLESRYLHISLLMAKLKSVFHWAKRRQCDHAEDLVEHRLRHRAA